MNNPFISLTRLFAFSYSANFKGMNPIILTPAMGKYGLLNLGLATSLEEGKLNSNL